MNHEFLHCHSVLQPRLVAFFGCLNYFISRRLLWDRSIRILFQFFRISGCKIFFDDIPIDKSAHILISFLELLLIGFAVDITPLKERNIPLDLAFPMVLLEQLHPQFFIHHVNRVNFVLVDDGGLNFDGWFCGWFIFLVEMEVPNVVDMLVPKYL